MRLRSRLTRHCGLERAFGSSAEMWMGLQADYDLEVARLANDVSLNAIRRVIAAE